MKKFIEGVGRNAIGLWLAWLVLYTALMWSESTHAGNSTINTTVPAANSALQSAPIRANFLAAATDINGLIGMNNSATAPASPVLGQLWLNTTATPYVLNVWDGAAWDAVGTLNSSAHRWLVPIPQGGTGLTSPGAVGNVLTSTGTAWASTAPTNIGTVTSVGLILPTALFNTTGSPITTSGTFAASLNSQSTGTFFAGPATGGSAVPTFRGIAVSDVPTLNQNTTGTAANVTGVVGVANGGTALTSPGASGNVLTSNGTGWVSSTPTAGSVSSVGLSLPLSIFSVSGSPVTTSGTLTGTLNTEPANYVWAGPTTGSAAQPAFRSLVLNDLPLIACGNLSNATAACSTAIGTLGATIPLLNGSNQWSGIQTFQNTVLGLFGGSTGITSFASANATATNYTITFPAATGTVATMANINTALPSTSALYKGTGGAGVAQAATSGTDYAPGTSGNATGIVKSTTGTGALTTAVAADFPTLNQNTTGNAATVTTNANLTGDVTSVGNASTVVRLNGTSLSGLATGILKNTTGTGVPSIAVSGTDYAPATAGSALLAANGSGGFATPTAATVGAPITVVTTVAVTPASATAVSSGLSVTLTNGGTYLFEIHYFERLSATANTTMSLNFGSVTATSIEGSFTQVANVTIGQPVTVEITSLSTTQTSAVTTATFMEQTARGTLAAGSGGTFIPGYATAATSTDSLLVGSWMRITRIN